ncbi:MAG: glycosyltransferase family 4 protein [Clostridiales bacterium]|nr:glycosyltransferase family 4 protein [Clostridiales bacterium]
MLRIGQFTDTFLPVVDGVGRVALAYSETLSRMGHQVSVICPMNDTGHRGGYPFELVDFQAVTIPGAMRQYKAGEAPWDPHYRSRMRMIPLDIVHAHSPFTCGSEALRLAAQRDIPLVATFHSKYYDDFLKLTKSEKLAKMGVKFVVDYYERCDEVWAVGQATADVLHEYGYQGKIHVMPNGVTMRTAESSAVSEVDRRWGLGHDPLILFVGQMNWKKNIATVLEACALLRRQGIRFHLILAGQGPDLKEIEQKIYDLDIVSCSHLAGHITDHRLLDGLYSRATLFAFPSLYDNAPMVVRESAVMGTPAVMVRGSCAAEIIEHGVNGFLCENDAENLCQIFKEALDDPARCAQIGQKARETIPVPWETIMETVVERYERLIALGREGKLNKKFLRVI